MRLAFSYIRFSTKRQILGTSKERQLKLSRRFAKRHKLYLDEHAVYYDPGRSARKAAHLSEKGKLRAFLDLIGTDKVPVGSVLIIEAFDRLSRMKLDDGFELVRSILKAGVDIVILSMNRWYTREHLDDLGARNEMENSLKRAWEESQRKHELALHGWKRKHRRAAKRKRPHGRRCPSWVRLRKGQYEPHPERWPVMEKMVALAKEGMSTTDIAAVLRSDPERYPCWLRAGAWKQGGVHRMLHHCSIHGTYQPGRLVAPGQTVPQGEPIPDYYPALMTEDEHRDLLAGYAARRHGGGRPPDEERNLFSGLLWDASTKSKLYLRIQTIGGKVYLYLAPPREVKPPPGRTHARVRCDELELLLFHLLLDLTDADLTQEGPDYQTQNNQEREEEEAIKGLRQQLDLLEGQLGRVKTEEAARRISDTMDRLAEEFTMRQARLDSMREHSRPVAPRVLRDIHARIKDLQRPDCEERLAKRRALRAHLPDLIESIWVYVEMLPRKRRILHVQVYLHGGAMRYTTGYANVPPDTWVPLNLADQDLREGYPPRLPAKG